MISVKITAIIVIFIVLMGVIFYKHPQKKINERFFANDDSSNSCYKQTDVDLSTVGCSNIINVDYCKEKHGCHKYPSEDPDEEQKCTSKCNIIDFTYRNDLEKKYKHCQEHERCAFIDGVCMDIFDYDFCDRNTDKCTSENSPNVFKTLCDTDSYDSKNNYCYRKQCYNNDLNVNNGENNEQTCSDTPFLNCRYNKCYQQCDTTEFTPCEQSDNKSPFCPKDGVQNIFNDSECYIENDKNKCNNSKNGSCVWVDNSDNDYDYDYDYGYCSEIITDDYSPCSARPPIKKDTHCYNDRCSVDTSNGYKQCISTTYPVNKLTNFKFNETCLSINDKKTCNTTTTDRCKWKGTDNIGICLNNPTKTTPISTTASTTASTETDEREIPGPTVQCADSRPQSQIAGACGSATKCKNCQQYKGNGGD